MNVKQSGRARMLILGLSGFPSNDAFLRPVQFNSVRTVEAHWWFFVMELQTHIYKCH